MTGRQNTPRQEPLGPEVGLSELVTRMISANQNERAQRARAIGERARRPDEERSKPEYPPA